jgi:hypothetical protein
MRGLKNIFSAPVKVVILLFSSGSGQEGIQLQRLTPVHQEMSTSKDHQPERLPSAHISGILYYRIFP